MLGLGINISKYRSTGQVLPLLDQFPGAAAAYSLRELSTDWEGQPVVRVRRDVDNTEADFTMTEILDGELLAWVYGASSAAAFNTLPADHGSGAEAAFSLRYVSSSYSGDVVRVRRSLDNAESDFNPTEITDGTLKSWALGNPSTLPADHGTGADAAYSMRYVSSSYSGDVVRIRRSSDNAEMDFNPTEITDGTLTAWTGASNGFVVTWYDQVGSSDAIQATTIYQPQLVTSGVVETLNGKPAMLSANTGGGFATVALTSSVSYSGASELSVFVVFDTNGIAANRWIVRTDTSINLPDGIPFRSNVATLNAYRSGDGNAVTLTADQNVGSVIWDGTGYTATANGVSGTKDTSTKGTTNWDFTTMSFGGNYNSSNAYSLPEAIVYLSDQTSIRESIELEQAHYYEIAAGVDAYVTTWYDQTVNPNNLAESTAGSQPVIVSAGVLHTKNGLPSISMDNSKILRWAGDTSVFVSGNTAEYTVFNVKSMNTVVNYGQSLPQITFDFGTNRVRTVAQINADGAGPETYPLRFYANNIVNIQNMGPGWTGLLSCYAESGSIDNSTTLARLRLRREDIFNNSITLNYGSKFNDGTAQFLYFSATPDADLSETIIYASYDVPEKSDIYANQSQYYGTRLVTKNGYVTTWYDQSGNTFDFTQSTTTLQPKIVNSGALIQHRGIPYIETDALDDYMQTGSWSGFNAFTLTTVSFHSSAVAVFPITGSSSTSKWGFYNVTGPTYTRTSIVDLTPSPISVGVSDLSNIATDDFCVITAKVDNTQHSHYYNGKSAWPTTIDGSISLRSSTGGLLFGGIGNTPIANYNPSLVTETILYKGVSSHNPQSINSSINKYYNIY